MGSRLRVHGHSIQPMLVAFPFGLFICATLFDLAASIGGPTFLGEVGYWTVVAGLVSAGLAGVAGMVDLWDVPRGAIRRMVLAFNGVNTVVAVLFLFSCLARAAAPDRGVPVSLALLEVVGLVLGGFGVRVGGRLIRALDDPPNDPDGFSVLAGAVSSRAVPAPRIAAVGPVGRRGEQVHRARFPGSIIRPGQLR
jgi:uncharacterized membrane protein